MSAQLKICPNCGNSFHCNVAYIEECQCNGIAISEEAKDSILKLYSDCLCRDCLKKMK